MYRTLYEAIGVPSNATKEEIEAACLKLGEYYRSQWAVKGAAERYFEIEEAYETLTDLEKRRAYDKLLSGEGNPSSGPFADAFADIYGDIFANNAAPVPPRAIKEEETQRPAPSVDTEPLPLVSWSLGRLNPAMVCPHCAATGAVYTKLVTQKIGISGGKATAALLTGGASLLVAGLSRKAKITEAHCTECNNTWHF